MRGYLNCYLWSYHQGSNKVHNPFFCPHCTCLELAKEISNVKSTISTLSDKLTHITSSIPRAPTLPSCGSSGPDLHQASPDKQPAIQAKSSSIPSTAENSSISAKASALLIENQNRNLNIVVFGIPECKAGEPRWKLDLLNVTNLFSKCPASTPTS